MREVLTHIYHFLATQDMPTILRESRKFSLTMLAKSIYTWLIITPICTYLLWTKKFKAIIALVSLGLFVLLAHKTLTQSGDTVDLHSVLLFVFGTAALVGLNLYLLFVRE